MALFSDNCVRYYDVARLAVYGTASVEGTDDERCSVPLPTINSCQRHRMEHPDAVTDRMAREEAAKGLVSKGCPEVPTDVTKLKMDYRLTQYAHTDREYSPEELMATGNVSNCAKVANNVNDVTHTMTASCFAFGDVTKIKNDRGEPINVAGRSGRLRASATLGVCDVSEEAIPQVMEDLRNLAAHHLRNREVNAYDVDPQNLECTFAMHPR